MVTYSWPLSAPMLDNLCGLWYKDTRTTRATQPCQHVPPDLLSEIGMVYWLSKWDTLFKQTHLERDARSMWINLAHMAYSSSSKYLAPFCWMQSNNPLYLARWCKEFLDSASILLYFQYNTRDSFTHSKDRKEQSWQVPHSWQVPQFQYRLSTRQLLLF